MNSAIIDVHNFFLLRQDSGREFRRDRIHSNCKENYVD